MKKRWLLLIPVVLIAIAVGAWVEPTHSVRGWVRGEPFYQGRPASYWEEGLIDPEPKEQMRIPQELESGKAAAVPVLVYLLGSRHEPVRTSAAGILTKLGPPAADAVPALLTRFNDDPDPTVRAISAQALGAIKPTDPAVIKAFIGKLHTDDRDFVIRPLSNAAADARAAIPDLIEIARDTKQPPVPRWEAIRTLGKIGRDSKPAVPILIGALKDNDELVREHAAEALGDIGAPEAIPHLTRALGDEAGRVRRDAVRSLGLFGPAAKSALPEAEKLLKDSEPLVREAARAALRRIDPDRKE
jgi:HEAT repeat protein